MQKYAYKVLLAMFLTMALSMFGTASQSRAQGFPPYIPPARFTNGAPVHTYEVINAWPHDPGAFTQGLLFHDGALFESTGLYGESSLRKVELETGKVLQQTDLSDEYFAEGLALWSDTLVQLTWQNNVGFVYDLETLEKQREWPLKGEGWGLTSDGQSLIMSDGTNQIHFLDPTTFATRRTIRVFERGLPILGLNELEYVKGEIYANRYGTDYILRIDPANGRVRGAIDFTGLLQQQDQPVPVLDPLDVLNGIAYDAATDRLFVTGKRWPALFEVRIVPLGS
jgi:glutaminyl-peptide cyclotransferase